MFAVPPLIETCMPADHPSDTARSRQAAFPHEAHTRKNRIGCDQTDGDTARSGAGLFAGLQRLCARSLRILMRRTIILQGQYGHHCPTVRPFLAKSEAMASKPVMEGKAVLFKRFADLDAFDVEVEYTDPDKFIECVKGFGNSFGGINLEDIKAPECFESSGACARSSTSP